ncbi:MAG: glycosylase [Clostridia bacterium]|nr:glycosylase [Clostridia bacterium]
MKQWLKNAVFYEIYPQSFMDTNADGIGDFKGIIQKLDYIKAMGFTAIWMNPCYASPFTDAGYDVEDYYLAAPRYGTNEDLRRLFAEAHARDMHVILDLVPGHTAYTCKWFQESMKPEKNPYSSRYVWTDSPWESLDNVDGIRGTIRGISQRNGCCGVNYYSTQPALNYGFAHVEAPWQHAVDSPEALATREELLQIIRFWLGLGCDGFRVDMAGSLVKNDDGQVETIRLWQDLLARVREEYPEAAFVSEWGEPDKALLAGYDMDFLLHFGPSHYNDLFREDNLYFSGEGKGDLRAFFDLYLHNLALTEGKGLICIPSGNHDMTRIAHHLDDKRLRLAYAFLMSMPGVPFIYYGDEIGMRYLEGITSVEGGYERTGARSPMQWDSGVNSGFSAAPPDRLYIPLDPDTDRPNVAAQLVDEGSLLNELKGLIALRKETPALQESAAFIPVCIDGYPLVYKRCDGEKTVLVVINPADREATCAFEGTLGNVLYCYGETPAAENGVLTVPACSAAYIELA